MEDTKERMQHNGLIAMMLIIVAVVLSGCQTTDTSVPELPSASEGQSKNLNQIMRDISDNQEVFRSLKANCRILIKSPLLPQRMSQIELDGTLTLRKPRQIHFVLYRGGRLAMKLIGNGEKYKVKQPIFDDTYGGKYDSPVAQTSDRLHILPDDLADALDLRSLFHGRPQVLKSYPERWDIMAGSLRNPVTYPPVWIIDSLTFSPGEDVKLRVANSVMVDRRDGDIQRIDKYTKDGSLRTTIWYRNVVPVQVSEQTTVDLPRNILIWYPPPLEGTIINIRFTKYQINIPVEESEFSLGG